MKKSHLFAFLSLSMCLAGCSFSDLAFWKKDKKEEEPTPVVGDANWVDYAHNGSVVLNLEYKNKDFYKDGVGEVELKTVIDGDTAHFYPVIKTTSSAAIKARYYGVDTPESTGRIQEYGKAASNFNKEKLKKAAANGTIVLSSAQTEYGAPNPDSTGGRYVSLIWINETKKNADISELYLLNLELVEYGYSWAKNVADMPDYAPTFYAAEKQATKYKLNLFSGEKDPLFNYGDYQECDLLSLKVATENYISDRNYTSELDGAKVRIRGTIAGFADGTLYLQSYFTEEASELVRGAGNGITGGEYASINVFCGMSDIPSKYKVQNTYIELCAVAQYSENFGFQLTGAEGHFKQIDSLIEDDDARIILKAEENEDDQKLHVFEYTAAELDSVTKTAPFTCLNCAVKLTDAVTCTRAILSADKTEATLSFDGVCFEAYVTFKFSLDPEKPFNYWKEEEDFVGKSFNLEGIYTYHQTASKIYYQFVFTGSTGISVA